jgi:phosphoenolpyruvate carboxykinase (ATP)
MHQPGFFDPAFGPASLGLKDLKNTSLNFEAPRLYEEAIQRKEAIVAAGGALVAETGVHTGRSPKDKFIVRDALTISSIWWENTNAMSLEHFDALYGDMVSHAKGKDLFAQDLYAGAEPAHRLKVRIFTEYAWHYTQLADPATSTRIGRFSRRFDDP